MAKTIRTIAAVAIVLVLVAALAWTFALADETEAAASDYENRLTGTYQKSLNELTVSVGELQNALSKVQVASSQRQYTLLLSEVWRTSGEAATVLGQLPAAFSKSAETSAFLTQTSDYAYFLLKKATDQTPVTAEDTEQLVKLQTAASQLVVELQAAQSAGVDASVLDGYDFYSHDDAGEAAVALVDLAEPGASEEGTGAEQQGESKYPHLIYDGPFSESTENAQPLGLGAGDVDEETARQKAKEFVGDSLSGELVTDGTIEGRIRAYSFSGSAEDGRIIDIAITVTGGHCLYFRISGGESDAPVPGDEGTTQPGSTDDTGKPDDARGRELAQLGKDFLNSRGLTSMESTYAQYYNNTAVINYAYVQDGTLVYADLMKVWLDVETGEPLGFEANNYLFAHVERSIPAPLITEDEARMSLSTVLEVQSVRMALIPLTATDERFCYEFKCKYGGDSYIVYVSALTGNEEQIFRIIDSEEGQLVV